jgi:hypothetical protein
MDQKIGDAFDLDSLLHPAQAFDHPSDVVNDPDLTLNEKRAILASWASDACALEAAPALRQPPGSRKPVTFDEIMDALRDLDEEARAHGGRRPKYKKWLGALKGRKRSGSGDLGSFG